MARCRNFIISGVLVSEFDYFLPDELIAQEPLADRAASRLLHLNRNMPDLADRQFRDFPDLLRPDDLVVFNNTRVLPARLFGHRSGARAQPISSRNPAAREFLRGTIEVLLTRQVSQEPNEWECLVRPGRKIGVGEQLYFGAESASEVSLQAEVVGRESFGERRIRFDPTPDFLGTIERIGHVPLPPYIVRQDQPVDRERYQTVYAQAKGSVAAPTAGLHFTPEVLNRIRERGIETAQVTLHVGLGTFQPVREERVEDHTVHLEPYSISADAATVISRALDTGRRIVAIGTTTVRALECSAGKSSTGRLNGESSNADIFIYPGYKFRVVSALLTNFHLPQSTLLMLVSSLAGKDRIIEAYRHAVRQQYRFYSYGDCMFVE